MADSSTLRARRTRLHKAGDHSICHPERCPAAAEREAPVADVPSLPSLSGLGARGQKLWDDVTASWSPPPLLAANLMEACRIADRLETLDRQLKGGDWLRFRARNDDGSEVIAYVDKVLSEAREQATAFRMITADLIKAAGSARPQPKGGGKLASVTALLNANRPTG
jgi:hypothetical protein